MANDATLREIVEFRKAEKEYWEFRREMRAKVMRKGTPESLEYETLDIDWPQYVSIKAFQMGRKLKV